jgi:hypothetical protein
MAGCLRGSLNSWPQSVVQEVQGLTLKLKPFESENEDFVEER